MKFLLSLQKTPYSKCEAARLGKYFNITENQTYNTAVWWCCISLVSKVLLAMCCCMLPTLLPLSITCSATRMWCSWSCKLKLNFTIKKISQTEHTKKQTIVENKQKIFIYQCCKILKLLASNNYWLFFSSLLYLITILDSQYSSCYFTITLDQTNSIFQLLLKLCNSRGTATEESDRCWWGNFTHCRLAFLSGMEICTTM